MSGGTIEVGDGDDEIAEEEIAAEGDGTAEDGLADGLAEVGLGLAEVAGFLDVSAVLVVGLLLNLLSSSTAALDTFLPGSSIFKKINIKQKI
jgi:hypothetical protein